MLNSLEIKDVTPINIVGQVEKLDISNVPEIPMDVEDEYAEEDSGETEKTSDSSIDISISEPLIPNKLPELSPNSEKAKPTQSFLRNLPYEERSFSKTFSKTITAAGIAYLIIIIFGIMLFLGFILIGLVIYLAVLYPPEVTDRIVSALGGNLFEAIKIIGTIFSPLLAFILGYYFKKESETSE